MSLSATRQRGDPALCLSCGGRVIPLEMSLTMKLVDRAARRYYCRRCLAAEMGTTEAALDELAAYFRANHCALFC